MKSSRMFLAGRQQTAAAPIRVDQTLLRQTVSGPSGVAAAVGATRRLWKMVRIGKVQPDGQFEQVLAAASLRPAPWPTYRSAMNGRHYWKGRSHNFR